MLLQKALLELDGEIDRLSRIRAIVAGLHTTNSAADLSLTLRKEPADLAPAEFAAAQAAPAKADRPEESLARGAADAARPAPESATVAVPMRKARKVRLEHTTRVRRPVPPAARALGGSIPTGPVFIAHGSAVRNSPSSRERDTAEAAKMKAPPAVPLEGTLDALLRELSYRPSQGA